MSRYGFTPSFRSSSNMLVDDTLSAVVGWDNPLQTFFGDVENADGHLLISTMHGLGKTNVQSVEDLEYLIGYVIPNEIKAKLKADCDKRTEPTPLQKRMASLLDEGSGL